MQVSSDSVVYAPTPVPSLSERELAMLNGLESGDLVFFGGQASTSRMIQWSGNSRWSHVALVLRDPRTDALYLAEATNGPGFGQVDVVTRQPVGGVRVVDLIKRMQLRWAELEPDYGVSKLLTGRGERARIAQKLWAFIKKQDGKPYEPDFWRLARAWWDGPASCLVLCGCPNEVGSRASTWGLNAPTTDTWFCSKLVSAALVYANVLRSRRLAPNMYGMIAEPPDEVTVADLERIAPVRYVDAARASYAPVRQWEERRTL